MRQNGWTNMNGIMDIINIPMGYVIRICNSLLGNQYILALLVFAVIVELLMLPLSIKRQKNSIKQARLRPKELAIRKKYGNSKDPQTQQKIQQDIQAMYQKEGFNPMSGCLPLLIQFPVIIALYNIVINPLRYICGLSTGTINSLITAVNAHPDYAGTTFVAERNIDLMGAVRRIMETDGPGFFAGVEGFAEKIGSVADLPNLTVFGAIDLAATPSFKEFGWLLLVPLITFLSYFFSMKINRKLMYQPAGNDAAMGCSNKMMDLMMPLMSVFISFTVPAALGVYWIIKCVLGVGIQAILSKAMPIPSFTDEDYKAAEKAYEATQKNKPRTASAGKVRSLHHIDDEDYDEKGNYIGDPTGGVKREEKTSDGAAAAETGKENSLLGHVSMKEEAKHEKKTKKKNKKDDQ